jgi:2-polyprenyl-3-methyl-5-hydroxy-6-metoxy-1,4-benzoquinol methylase
MVCNRQDFCEYTPLNGLITVGYGQQLKLCGKSIVKIISHIGNFKNIVKLSEVYHVPQLEANLISISKLINHGAHVIFDKIQCYTKIGGEIIAIQNSSGRIYPLGTANNYTRTTIDKNKKMRNLEKATLLRRSLQKNQKMIVKKTMI